MPVIGPGSPWRAGGSARLAIQRSKRKARSQVWLLPCRIAMSRTRAMASGTMTSAAARASPRAGCRYAASPSPPRTPAPAPSTRRAVVGRVGAGAGWPASPGSRPGEPGPPGQVTGPAHHDHLGGAGEVAADGAAPQGGRGLGREALGLREPSPASGPGHEPGGQAHGPPSGTSHQAALSLARAMPDGTPDRHTEQPPETGEFLALEAGDDDDAGDGADDAGDGADAGGDGADGGGDDAGDGDDGDQGRPTRLAPGGRDGESGRVTRSRLPRPGRGAPPGWAAARPRWPRWPGRHHRR